MHSFQADDWWVPEQSTGPFTAGVVVPAHAANQFAAVPGVTRAEPVLLLIASVSGRLDDAVTNLIAVNIGGLGSPRIKEGRAIEATGEVVLDETVGYDVGDPVLINGQPLTVVGVADNATYRFGVATTFLSLPDAQRIVAGGAPVASAIVTQGDVTTPPPGFAQFSNDETIADLTAVLGSGLSSVTMVRTILLTVAAGIVAFIIYLSSLERVRDMAVLKAVGATDRFLSAGLAVQGVLVTLLACLASFVVAIFIKPLFELEVQVTSSVYVQMFVIAVVVGLLASLVGIRKAFTTDPAVAFS